MNKLFKASVFPILLLLAATISRCYCQAEGALHNSVPPGYRGVALEVKAFELQYLKPGDIIDVLTTFEARTSNNVTEWVTATMLQNILILDVKAPACRSQSGTIQIAVNPMEAEYLHLAVQSKKIITVSLRNEGDRETRPLEMATMRKLFR